MSKFSRTLINDMWDGNVRFDSIMHIPTLIVSSSERVSDQFQDFLDDAYEEHQNSALLKQCPALESTLKEIRENDDIKDHAGEVAQDLYRDCDYEFLVKLEISIPYNFSFNEEGKYLSNSLGGYYQMQWIFAKDMTEAAEIAIKRAEELWEKECEKANREKGITA